MLTQQRCFNQNNNIAYFSWFTVSPHC